MEQQLFLETMLPSTGYYCAVELTTKKRQHVFCDSLYDLADTIEALDKQDKETYYALASFVEAANREAVNAKHVRCIFLDIDVGVGERCYPTKRAAMEALIDFMEITGLSVLGEPWIVDSGGGLHVYFPFPKDVSIAEWKRVAEAFKRKAKELGFRIDMTVTADAARILRPPGTFNHKYDPPRMVAVKHVGGIFELQAISDALGVVAAPVLTEVFDNVLNIPGERPND